MCPVGAPSLVGVCDVGVCDVGVCRVCCVCAQTYYRLLLISSHYNVQLALLVGGLRTHTRAVLPVQCR